MESAFPFFSIIIPTYNRAHMLPKAIDSVLAQSFQGFEIIVVDDGSTDDTEEVIKPYLSDVRINLILKANGGVSAARNLGASRAQGSYLVFLDSDDLFKREYLNEVSKQIDQNPDVVFVSVEFRMNNVFEKSISAKKPYGKSSSQGLFLAGSFVIRSKLFLEIGGYDNLMAYGENMELSFRLASRQISKRFIDEPLVIINRYSNSRTSSSPINQINSTQYVLEKHKVFFAENRRVERLLVQVIGVSYLRINKFSEARKYLLKAYSINPIHLGTFLRLVIAYFPVLSKKIYY